MAKITPKLMKEVFTEEVTEILPANNKIKRGVAILLKWSDPTFKEKRLKDFSNPIYKEKIKKVRKEVGNRPELKEKKRQITKDLHADPEFRKKYEEGMAKKIALGPTVKQLESAKKQGEKRQRIIQTPHGKFKTLQGMADFFKITKASCQERMRLKPHLYYYEDQGPGNPTYENVIYTPYGIFSSKSEAMKHYSGDIKKGPSWWKKITTLYPNEFYIVSEIKREW